MKSDNSIPNLSFEKKIFYAVLWTILLPEKIQYIVKFYW